MKPDTTVQHLALTPAGVMRAFSQPEPDPVQAQLQTLLAGQVLPTLTAWLLQDSQRQGLLAQAQTSGWVQQVGRAMRAPNVKLDDFLSHVIASLSSLRKAALASGGGFCVGHAGYTPDEAEALCAAAADFSEFARRQRARGWQGASHMASFHEDIGMLVPTTSFVPFWVEGTDYCLVLAGEPLINNPVLVELVWGIKAAGARFNERAIDPDEA